MPTWTALWFDDLANLELRIPRPTPCVINLTYRPLAFRQAANTLLAFDLGL